MALAGKGGNVKIGANTVTELSNWKLDIDLDLKDKTNFASNGWKETISTLKSWSGSCDGTYNVVTDTNGQKAMQDGVLNGTSISLGLWADGTHNYAGTAWIKKLSVEEPVDDVVKFSIDFEGTGALTYT